MQWFRDMVHPHFTLLGPWPHKTAFPTPMVWPLDESQGSSPLQGHGSWLMCEVALSTKLERRSRWSEFGTQGVNFSGKSTSNEHKESGLERMWLALEEDNRENWAKHTRSWSNKIAHHSLVENIAKKNRSCFPIAVPLTTLICSR